MFMDVVTDFGDGYTPTDADNLERGPVRVRNALQFSLNIPAVKALAVVGNDAVQQTAEAMGIQFRDGEVDAGLSFALGVEEVRPKDLVRAYGVLGNGGELVYQTTIVSVTDDTGEPVLEPAPGPEQAIDPGAAGDRDRHPGRQHRSRRQPVLGPVRRSTTAAAAGRRRSRPAPTTTPATSTRTATSRRPAEASGTTASTRWRSARGTATPTTRWSRPRPTRCSRST